MEPKRMLGLAIIIISLFVMIVCCIDNLIMNMDNYSLLSPVMIIEYPRDNVLTAIGAWILLMVGILLSK